VNRNLVLLLFILAAPLVLAAAPFVGMEAITPRALFGAGADSTVQTIFWQLRVPRVLLGFLAGAGLAISGMVFQAMFRNPLATPFTLGVSSGASLGASLAVRLGWGFAFLGFSAQSLAAFVGAMAAIVLVYGLTQVRRGFSTSTMLLAGVAVNFLCSSLILFIQYTSDHFETHRVLRWLMGGLQRTVGYESVLRTLPIVLLGAVAVYWLTHELNLLSTGEELAASRGVAVDRTKRVFFFVVSLVVGAVVAMCGPIGFVGLMGPHICRLLVGPNHRRLMPATFLFGGIFLVVCDSFARVVFAPSEMPVGIVTSFLGGPFFLWLLLGGAGEKRLV